MLIIFFSLNLFFLSHPLSIGLMLLTQTILISLSSGLMNLTYWYSYILFLVMIGGMLILFIYMTSVASNEKFKFSSNLMFFYLMIFFIMFMLLFMDFFYFNFNTNLMDQMHHFKNINFNLTLSKLFFYPLINTFFMMTIYLLITLIVVVKITNNKLGPLRQMN
uniref:NADH-ubiquinone oxidoreductase chain 6 n=1 Tax=Cerambycidae sp. 4 KM-2017 TaxID=2219289 RepID=A0A346RGA7_9CUCU|nr:NADH dehydrogenase subunit 6 [Cerambycidae sp. 4 KM-2017]